MHTHIFKLKLNIVCIYVSFVSNSWLLFSLYFNSRDFFFLASFVAQNTSSKCEVYKCRKGWKFGSFKDVTAVMSFRAKGGFRLSNVFGRVYCNGLHTLVAFNSEKKWLSFCRKCLLVLFFCLLRMEWKERNAIEINLSGLSRMCIPFSSSV